MGRRFFYTDCAWVASSVVAGRQHCTHACAVGADIWLKIFWAIDDFFGETQGLLQVKKVRAHTSFASIAGNAELAYLWWGNRIADEFAKEGAKQHPADANILESVAGHSAASTCVAKFLSRAAQWFLAHRQIGRAS